MSPPGLLSSVSENLPHWAAPEAVKGTAVAGGRPQMPFSVSPLLAGERRPGKERAGWGSFLKSQPSETSPCPQAPWGGSGLCVPPLVESPLPEPDPQTLRLRRCPPAGWGLLASATRSLQQVGRALPPGHGLFSNFRPASFAITAFAKGAGPSATTGSAQGLSERGVKRQA